MATHVRSTRGRPKGTNFEQNRAGGWTPLDEGVSVGGPGGAALPWLHGVEFRVNAAAGAAQDAAGPISQTVAYTASCAGPGP